MCYKSNLKTISQVWGERIPKYTKRLNKGIFLYSDTQYHAYTWLHEYYRYHIPRKRATLYQCTILWAFWVVEMIGLLHPVSDIRHYFKGI